MKSLISPGTRDEDLQRKLYISMIKKFVIVAQGEMVKLGSKLATRSRCSQ